MLEVNITIQAEVDEQALEKLVDLANELGVMLVAATGERELHVAGDAASVAEFVIRLVDVAG